jgi:signal transduction histidine kinase
VLAQGDHTTGEDDFYNRLCAATTRATSMQRAIIFLYDPARRRVRAAGSHGVDISIFADAFITVESAPMAKRALELDRVIDASADLERELPAEYVRLLGSTTVVCSPMAARGRWLGAIVADRGLDSPPLEDAEREVLWILGKTAALAALARTAARQHEKARQLEQRIDLAREVHTNVVQRLFGVSLALAGSQPLDERTRARCAEELKRSLTELRVALQRPLGRPAPTTRTTLAAELSRLQRQYPGLGIEPHGGGALSAPRELEALAQSVLEEGVRNAHKHASPTRVVAKSSLTDSTFVLELTNDGVTSRAGSSGMGLRLAAVDAMQAGGVLEFGPSGPDRWQLRLVVPCERT